MKKFSHWILLLLLSILTQNVHTQNGIFDLRFVLHEIDCANDRAFVDIQIKSPTIADSFHLGSANLRMSFNRAAVANPAIASELGYSGVVSFVPIIAYGPHNLNGSIDTIISYNIIFQIGLSQDGALVDNNWAPVGRLQFDILDYNECFNLNWHDQTIFPATVMNEYVDDDGILDANGQLFDVTEGSYTNLGICFDDYLPDLTLLTTTDANCGQADGSATVLANGTVPPYAYAWNTSPAQTAATANNLAAGNYTVTTTDANGCQSSLSVPINNQQAPTLSIGSTISETCGAANGQATVLINGGQAPFSYSWNTSPVQTTQTATNLAAGTYSVQVTDATNCSANINVTINEIPRPNIALDSIQDASCGQSNGSIAVSGNGGMAPYSFVWNTIPQQAGSSIQNQVAGTYTVELTDANNCRDTASFTISNVAGPGIILNNVTDAHCGQADGSAMVSPSGGTAPYSYSWSTTPPQTSQTATNLVAGNYTVSITDANNCSISTLIAIADFPPPTTTITSVQDATCSNADGSATITATSGSPPYTYSWSTNPPQTTPTATNLAAGNYTVTVTDSEGCQSQTTTTIGTVSSPVVSISNTTLVNCNANNGTASAQITGGIPPYTYSWSTTPPQTTATATNLAAGSYTVIVTDDNGCVDSTTALINTVNGPSITLDSVQASTCSNANGSATVSATGGTAPYSFLWNTNPPQFTATATNLPAGTYTATVTDYNDCETSIAVTITDQAAPTLSLTSSTDATCDADNGAASTSISDGTPPFSYSWNTTPAQTTSDASNLAAGTYTLTATDANGCTATLSVTINDISSPKLTLVSTTNEICGNANGSAVVSVNGGMAPFSYSWNDPMNQSSANASNLAMGTYTAFVSDANGCTDSLNVSIAETPGPSATISNTVDAICNAANGNATVAATNGTPPYQYSWNTLPVQTTATATNLMSGNYDVTVTDANNCSISLTATINDAGSPTLSIANVTDETCANANGSATISATGGSQPYTYSWTTTPPQTTATASNLSAGSYQVFVSDDNGCQSSTSITINSQNSPVATIASTQDAACGANTGSASAAVTGGQAPYTYTWNTIPPQFTQMAVSLPAGTYTVTVTDDNGCSSMATANISNANGPNVAITDIADAHCGQADGSITVAATAGTPPYTYNWDTSPPQSSATASNLPAGVYSVLITDANNCATSTSITIQDLPGPDISNINVSDAHCGQSDGFASISVIGGTSPYTYSWSTSPPQTGINAVNLVSDNYAVTVTDSNGCTVTQAFVVDDLPGPSLSVSSVIDASCGNPDGSASVSPSGGSGPYTYSWSTSPVQNAPVATNLLPGSYTATVIDLNGCSASIPVTVPNDTFTPSITLGDTINSCGSFVLDANNNGADFSWNTGDSTQAINVQVSDTYIVTVSYGQGCTATDSVVAQVFPQVFVDLGAPLQTDCNSITLDAGNNGADFLWSTGDTTQSIEVVTSDSYSVTVTNTFGCSTFASVAVNILGFQLPLPDLGSDTLTCEIALDLSSNVTNASAYFWSNGSNAPNTTVASTNTYSLTLLDANGCDATDSIFVEFAPPPSINLGDSISACSTITLDAENMGSTYLWSTGDTTQTLSVNQAGSYTVSVTSPQGCQAMDSVLITAINSPVAVDLGADTIVCGNVLLSANNPGSAYFWSTGDTTQSLLVQQSGQYFVSVADALGCDGSDTINVEVNPLPSSGFTDVTACGSAVLNAQNPGSTYLWSTNEITQVITVTESDVYTVAITDINGCTGTDSINVTINPFPEALFTHSNLNPLEVQFANSSTDATSFVWDFGDGNSSALSDPIHTYLVPGVYEVSLVASNACGRDTLVVEVNVSDVSIESSLNNHIALYPNPNQGNFTLELRELTTPSLTLSLHNQIGQIIFTQHIASPQSRNPIQLPNVPEGIYLLHIQTPKQSAHKTLIIR